MEVAEPEIKPQSSTFNPFPGLRPFGLEESHLFFGREGQSEEVLRKLAKNRFVGVVGTSGSGKSSLMYCGLVPILYGGFISGVGSGWRMVVTRPGGGPIKNLAQAIVKCEHQDKTSDEELEIKRAITDAVLRSSSFGLIEAIKQAGIAEKESVLVMVDQFEELFRFKRSSEGTTAINESLAFVKLLLEAVAQSEVPIYIVLTMRSDFIGECAQFPELTKLLNNSHYLIPRMTRNDLKNAITGPVSVGGGHISDHLVQQLLNDMGDNQDQLPILQHALMRTWDYWGKHGDEGEPMNIDHYESIGKMEKALSEHANEAYEELDERGQYVCEKLFKSLTERGADNRGIRHPSGLSEISTIAKAEEDEVINVINIFRAQGRSFLTPSWEHAITPASVIDISHESLMRVWDRLKAWVEEEAAAVDMYQRLSEASAMYQEGKTGLWRPPDLQLALSWKAKQQPTLMWGKRYNPAFERAMVYLDTSEKAHEADEANKVKLQKRALRRTRIFAIVLGIASIVSLGFLLYAVVQSQQAQAAQIIAEKKSIEAEEQKKIAEENSKAAELAKEKADKSAREALIQKEMADEQARIAEQQTQYALVSANEAKRQSEIANQKSKEAELERHKAQESATEALQQKTLAEDAQEAAKDLRLLSIAQSMAVKSINIKKDTAKKALVAYQAYLFNEQYGGKEHNPDVYDGLYYTLKALNFDSYNSLEGHKNAVRSLTFDPSGKYMYTTGSDGKVLRWNMDSAKATHEVISKSPVINRTLSVSPDGKVLACGTSKAAIQLFDLNQEQPAPSILKGHKAEVWDLVFTPDNQFLVSSSADGTILLWNIEAKDYTVIAKSESTIKSIALSPSGQHIVGGTADGKVIVWDRNNNNTSKVLAEEGASIHVVEFSNSGEEIATGDLLGNVKVWNLKTNELITALSGQSARINDIKFRPDDKLLAAASFDGTVHLWNTENYNDQPVVLNDHNSWVQTIAFSPDGNKLIAGCRDNLIRIWPTSTKLMAQQICSKLDRNMTQEEWARYVAEDIPYEKSCPDIMNKDQ